MRPHPSDLPKVTQFSTPSSIGANTRPLSDAPLFLRPQIYVALIVCYQKLQLETDSRCSLKSYDAGADVAIIEYKGDRLSIDASLLPGFQFRTDSLYEFIGEVQVCVLVQNG